MSAERDNRQYSRLPRALRVEMSPFVFPLSSQPSIEITSVNISSGGLLVECPRCMEKGDKLQVRIYIPSFNKFHPGFLKVFESDAGQYMQAIAEVAWVEKPGVGNYSMGLKFLDVHEDDWTALNNMIRKMIADEN